MTDFVTESNFDDIVSRHKSGEAKISLPPQVAKQFFLRVDNPSVKSTTGSSIFLKKLIIWLCNVSSPLVFISAMSWVFTGYGAWEASFIVPAAGICWIIVYGLTSDQGGWLIGTIPLLLCFPLMSYMGLHSGLAIFLFVLSIWLQRASYLLSTYWLIKIITTSYAAFEMMEEHVVIPEAVA